VRKRSALATATTNAPEKTSLTRYLTRDQATKFLRQQGIPMGRTALEKLAVRGDGPRYVIINGRALYEAADILAWIVEQSVRPVTIMRRGRARKTVVIDSP